MRVLVGAIAAATFWAAAGPGLSQSAVSGPDQPFTIDDLVSQEGIGNVRISPDSRWILLEKQAAWDRASTYKFDYYTQVLLSRIEVFSALDGRLRHTLADPEHAAGFIAGPFSPSGKRMVVFRLDETRWSMGVLTLETGAVRWFDVSPELARFGETVVWRSETEILAVACRNAALPVDLGLYSEAMERRRELWRRADNGRAPSSIFTPSGSSRDRRDKPPPAQLVRLDVETGRQTPILDGPIIDIALSPDGRTIAALMNGDDIQASPETVLFTGTAKQVRRLLLVDVATSSQKEPLSGRDLASHLMAWSPDSDRLIVFATPRGDSFDKGDFWILSTSGASERQDTSTMRPAFEADAQNIPIARASWSRNGMAFQVRGTDGKTGWLIVPPHGANRFLPQIEDGESIVTFDRSVVRATGRGLVSDRVNGPLLAEGRLVDPGTAEDFGARGAQNLDPAIGGRSILLDEANCLITSTRERRCLSPLESDETVVAASPNAAFAVTRRRSSGGALTIRLRSETGSVDLDSVNAFLDHRSHGPVVAIGHAGPQGEALHSWLLLPARRSSAPPPLVVMVYPGNVYGGRPSKLAPGALNLHINAAILSAAGYAVLLPSLPRDRTDPADFTRLAEQLVSIVGAACAEERCDPGRTALIGHSYGGPAVLEAATQTQAFKAIIASNGNSDLSQMLVPRQVYRLADAETVIGAGWLEGGQAGMGVPLGLDPQRYVDHSVLYEAGRIHTPTLLIESEFDGSGFGSLFGALYRLNREAGLVSYFGTSHEFVSPANVRDLHSRILEWLGRYLGSPNALDPLPPVPRPDLQNREDQKPVGRSVPD